MNLKRRKTNRLTRVQLDGVSVIFADSGQVFLASIVGAFFAGFDRARPDLLLSALVLMCLCWVIAIKLKG
jgi:hypothetical protein